ncbi:MAG: IS4 family transposase, partial [Nitrospirota bacterium]
EKRNNEDPRTIGNLFYLCCDEIQEIGFLEALLLIIEMLRERLYRFLFLPEKKIQDFISNFISALPLFFKARLQILMCES